MGAWGRRIINKFKGSPGYVVRSCLNTHTIQAMWANICNPSYSGGRDQEDHSSKPDQANNSGDSMGGSGGKGVVWWNGSSSNTGTETHTHTHTDQ
jgi:hypothetical protein